MSKSTKAVIKEAFGLLEQWSFMSLSNCNPVPLFEALRKYDPDKYSEIIRNALKAGGSAQQKP